ncbi:hypothetical protein Kpol_1004p22 [Vanderwaltozyma polyspora DSM 70294]|uniref:BZIP domain-containing protein n=1 Tax=Vanderwaltozyma polyspora (strain ATCC 22028 / DSM 70294 / BCRC 21397 / CBS 2163 / NBRC 10782 / NRRL Y-8283 / UCD 57-17) TaxID=436907 RepID=A7TJ79_VANPO|nr:uncharacterized protein Kpol_1004p22 [Vanderwaltozyma polyspora DSM 70294]EDO17648.1 hypothetical protein Kpol_1004p22 [Vanderwaltozyma polyspora DSM 70294]
MDANNDIDFMDFLTESSSIDSRKNYLNLSTSNKIRKNDIDAEARIRRTAQNRAAQRAFRERKEKKMKELENKVNSLENIHQKNEVETEFLRSQVLTLVNELKKYRSETTSDSKILKLVSNSRENTRDLRHDSITSLDSDQSPLNDISKFNLNLGHINLSNSPNSSSIMSLSPTASNNLPNASDSGLFSNDFNFNNQFDEQVSTFCAKMNNNFENRKKIIKKTYDEKIKLKSEFSDVNSVLASPSLSSSRFSDDNSSTYFNTRHHHNNDHNNTTTTKNHNYNNQSMKSEFPPLIFFSDNNYMDSPDNSFPLIDASLAFPNNSNSNRNNNNNNNNNVLFRDISTAEMQFMDESPLQNVEFNSEDAIKRLISEEPSPHYSNSVPHLHNNNVNSASLHPLTVLVQEPDDELDEDVVVPSTDSQLMRCSEIWDRITTNPRYTDLDIDGLCEELMFSAKCSDKGVVVASKDVHKVLAKHMA